MGTRISNGRDSGVKYMKSIWKSLNVPDYQNISRELYQFICKHHPEILNQPELIWHELEVKHVCRHVGSLKTFFKRGPIQPERFAVISFSQATYGLKHRVGLHADTLDPYVRLLWPIKNCTGSKTKFYAVPHAYLAQDVPDYDPNARGGSFWPTVDRAWRQIDEIELTTPVVFDASVPHEVCMAPAGVLDRLWPDLPATSCRLSLTVGFDRALPESRSVAAMHAAWTNFNNKKI